MTNCKDCPYWENKSKLFNFPILADNEGFCTLRKVITLETGDCDLIKEKRENI